MFFNVGAVLLQMLKMFKQSYPRITSPSGDTASVVTMSLSFIVIMRWAEYSRESWSWSFLVGVIGVENNLCGSWNLVVELPNPLLIGESLEFSEWPAEVSSVIYCSGCYLVCWRSDRLVVGCLARMRALTNLVGIVSGVYIYWSVHLLTVLRCFICWRCFLSNGCVFVLSLDITAFFSLFSAVFQ